MKRREDNKIKLSMLSTLPPVKGISAYTLNLLEAVAKKCEVDFFGFESIYPEFLYPGKTKTDEKAPKIRNVNVYNILTWYNPFSWIYAGFKISTDIIHAQWWSWFLAPIYLVVLGIAKARGKRIIMTIHNVKPHEKSMVKNFLNNSVIGLADEYIVHSENNKRMFIKETNTKKNIHVIPHGIIKMKKSGIPAVILRKKYDFKKSDKILIFFGNIREYKGLDVLLKALSLIKNSNVKLIVAGKPWKSFEIYSDLIEELGIKDRVKLFLEFNSENTIAELFKISDLAVFPYKEFESSSGAASVALNYEMPMVVTGTGSLPEYTGDRNVVAIPLNEVDLVRKISYALSRIDKLKKQSVAQSKYFNWVSISDKTIEVYKWR